MKSFGLSFDDPWKAWRGIWLLTLLMVLTRATWGVQQASGASQPGGIGALGPGYDPAIFERPVPRDQLGFLSQYAGATADKLFRDKQFQKLMKSFVPGCEFHYGRDMPLADALEMVMRGSKEPVLLRDGRYMTLAGEQGPYLAGRGLLWVDMQEGIALGAFFFTPTNGEPTPSLAVFSRQVKEKTIAMSDLPAAFEDDLIQWMTANRIPPVVPRYFLTGLNKRILLEHDEDYCGVGPDGVAPPQQACREMEADAADVDENAAYYLSKIHYATNGTAWMIGPDQVAWLQVRTSTCGIGPDVLGCRIRVTREHTRLIIGRPGAGVHPGRPPGRR